MRDQKVEYIRHFEAKFRYLFSRHPSIKTYAALAKALDIAPTSVSGWKNGTTSKHAEHIPIHYIENVCAHLDVDQDVLELEDLKEFKDKVTTGRRSNLWEALVVSAPLSPHLRIASESQKRVNLLTHSGLQRGIYNQDDMKADAPVFKSGDSVIIRVDTEPDWHVALFCKDRNGWQRLHPIPSRRETRSAGTFYYPAQNDAMRARYVRLDGVLGDQKLVAVITKNPLAEPILSAITDNVNLIAALNDLARDLREVMTPVSEVIQCNYHVEP